MIEWSKAMIEWSKAYPHLTISTNKAALAIYRYAHKYGMVGMVGIYHIVFILLIGFIALDIIALEIIEKKEN